MSWIHSDQRDHSEAAMRPGLFKLRLAKNAPYVPAVIYRPCPIEFSIEHPWIWLDRWYQLEGWYDVDARGRPAQSCDPYKIWLGGTEIDYADFQYLCDLRQHIAQYEPDAADADRNVAIDLAKLPPIGPRKA